MNEVALDRILEQTLNETMRLADSTVYIEFEEYVELTNLRQTLVDEIQKRKKLNPEEYEKLKQLQQYEHLMLLRMEALKLEAEEGIQRINGSKKQKDAYNNSIVQDSFMFDRRN